MGERTKVFFDESDPMPLAVSPSVDYDLAAHLLEGKERHFQHEVQFYEGRDILRILIVHKPGYLGIAIPYVSYGKRSRGIAYSIYKIEGSDYDQVVDSFKPGDARGRLLKSRDSVWCLYEDDETGMKTRRYLTKERCEYGVTAAKQIGWDDNLTS